MKKHNSDFETPRLSVEVADWKWASRDEITRMVERGTFFAYDYLDTLIK